MSMGAKLKQRRMKKGLSLQQVADEVGVSKAHIYELELNKVKNPSVETLKKLASLFEMPLSYFLDEDEDVEFQVMFRDLQKNVAQLSPQERAAVELMAKSLLEAKKSDDKN
jgi:transcriptional regulator with XRE-family HTH domain